MNWLWGKFTAACWAEAVNMIIAITCASWLREVIGLKPRILPLDATSVTQAASSVSAVTSASDR